MSELVQWLMGIVRGAQFWQIVQPWEQAVLTRCGKRPRRLASGFHLRLPYLDEVRVYNTRLRIAAVPFQTITTTDGQSVSVALSVGFHVHDAVTVMNTLQGAPEVSCSTFAQASVARFVAGRKTTELTLDAMEAEVLKDLNASTERHGLQFESVWVSDFAVVRTYRLLQETWRRGTRFDKADRDE